MTIATDRKLPKVGTPHDLGPADDAQALFREAKRRRRIRRMWMASWVALALLIAGVATEETRSGRAGPPPGSAHRIASPKTGATPKPGDQNANAAQNYAPIQVMGLADKEVAWAADGKSLYVSSDLGRSWRTVTPPTLADQSVSDRIDAMVGIGRDDLWLPVEDVVGLVPFSESADGSDRGEGVERSSDGGLTWSFSDLPGCLQTCGGNLSVSFVDPDHGFATIGPGATGPTELFSTENGGATWTRSGSLPDIGSINIGGPGSSAQVAFSSVLDGWAVTGPTFGENGQTATPGGVVYRTRNGGTTWSPATGLPAKEQFSLPTFFGDNGIMLSNPYGAPKQKTSIFTTSDDGATWMVHRIPTIAGLATFKPRGLGFRFAAISPSNWKIDVGSMIYSTSNGGKSWTTSVPRPSVGAGTVTAVAFSSQRNGLALLSYPPNCQKAVRDGSTMSDCFPTLAATSNGGKTWMPVHP